MTKLFCSLLTVLIVACAAPGGTAAKLVYRHQPDRKMPGVKTPGSMTFQELRRDKRTSTIKAFTRGTARPALREAMFAMRGCYDIAKARGARYFILLEETEMKDDSVISLVGFSNDKHVNPQKYFGLKTPLKPLDDGDKPTFLAVKDFEFILKGPQP